jgi:superfamily I DNA/RNA helicase
LAEPLLPFDLILLDEGQDSSRLTSHLIANQHDRQTVVVGDSAQQLYAWRGAVNALDAFPDHELLYLTQSFRFGRAVAELGNVFLRLGGQRPLVRGNPGLNSRLVEDMIAPDAILCRTKAGAMEEVIGQLELGRATYLQGGGDAMRRMAEAAMELAAGQGTNNPELAAFTSWSEVLDYVEVDPSGSDLRAFVRLVETHGAPNIITACDRLMNEPGDSTDQTAKVPVGSVVVSTIHGAKGLEWKKVRIGSDVAGPRVDPETWTLREPNPAEMMLNYVAATRAQFKLEPGALRQWAELEAVG